MIVSYLRHKFYNLLTVMIILFTFVLSGAIFLTFLGPGLYGLSRILVYFRLGDFTYNRGMYDNLSCYGSYIISGYLIILAVEHLVDYFKKMLPKNAYLRGVASHLISYTVVTMLFYFIVHLNYVYINIDFWVTMVITGFLYACELQFYPEGKNLNSRKQISGVEGTYVF